jgi:hypothetical protein
MKMAKVFISYSKKDYIGKDGKPLPGNPVDKVIEALSGSGISYWIDRQGLDPGVTYAEYISRNIKDCDVFLFLASREANASEWTLREISTAIAFGKRVLPVRLDHSDYADSVALYLSSVQYVDWQEMGEAEALERIVRRIRDLGEEKKVPSPQSNLEPLPKATAIVLYSGLVFLTALYAYLSFQLLWARTLRSSEIMGGLVGYICEFGLLMSAYYLIRLLRRRRCVFALPAMLVAAMSLAGMLIRDGDILLSSILLLGGWIFVLLCCIVFRTNGKNYFGIMDREQVLLRLTDPENLIIVYLAIKVFIIVVAHYTGAYTIRAFISPFYY